MTIATARHKKAGYRKLTTRAQKGAGLRRNASMHTRKHHSRHHKGEGYSSALKVASKKLGLSKHITIDGPEYGLAKGDLQEVVLLYKSHDNYLVIKGTEPKIYYGLHINHHHLNKVEQVYVRISNLSYSLRLVPMHLKDSEVCQNEEQFNRLYATMSNQFAAGKGLMQSIQLTNTDKKPYVVYRVKTISNKSVMHTMHGHYYVLLYFKDYVQRQKFLTLKDKLLKDENKYILREKNKKKINDEELLMDSEGKGIPLLYSVNERIVRSKQSRQPIISGANYYLPFTVWSGVSSKFAKMTTDDMMKALADAKFIVNKKASKYRLMPIQMPNGDNYYKGTGLALYRLDFANTSLDTEEALISFFPNYIDPLRPLQRALDTTQVAGIGGKQNRHRNQNRTLKRRSVRREQDGGGLGVIEGFKGLGNQIGFLTRKLTGNRYGRKKCHLYFENGETNSYYIIIQKRTDLIKQKSHKIAVVHENFMVKADYEKMFDRMHNLKIALDKEISKPTGYYPLSFFKKQAIRNSSIYTRDTYRLFTFGGKTLRKLKENKHRIKTSYHFLEMELTKGYKESKHGIGSITPISLNDDFVQEFETALRSGRQPTSDFQYPLTNPEPLIANMELLMSGLNTQVGDKEFTLPGLKKEYGQAKYLKHRLSEFTLGQMMKEERKKNAKDNRPLNKMYSKLTEEFLSYQVFCNIMMVLCKQWKRALCVGEAIAAELGGIAGGELLAAELGKLVPVELPKALFTESLFLESIVESVGGGMEILGTEIGQFATEAYANAIATAAISDAAAVGVGAAMGATIASPLVAGAIGESAHHQHNVGKQIVKNTVANTITEADEEIYIPPSSTELLLKATERYEKAATDTEALRDAQTAESMQKYFTNPNTLNDLVKNDPKFASMVENIQSILTTNDSDKPIDIASLLAKSGLGNGKNIDIQSVLGNKQSTEHLRNLCDVLLQLHNDDPDSKKQLIRNFRESLVDKAERIAGIKESIDSKKAEINKLRASIEKRQNRISNISKDKSEATNEEAITIEEKLIGVLEKDNTKETRQIDDLQRAIQAGEEEIRSMSSPPRPSPEEIRKSSTPPTEQPVEEPSSDEIRKMEESIVKANQEPNVVPTIPHY